MVSCLLTTTLAATLTSLISSVSGHTQKICVEVVNTRVTFYGGPWDGHTYLSYPTGGVILSNGPYGNGRYDFTSTLYDDGGYPSGVDLTNFECTDCGGGKITEYWQKIIIDGLACGSTYDVTTTTDTWTEYPGCTYPSITIPECTCDNHLDISCHVSGDPHFTSWDNTRHHFQGNGYYDYITKCDNNDIFPFIITAKQEDCGIYSPMTCITEIRVTLEKNGTNNNIENDGVIVFPSDSNADPTWLSSGLSAVGNDQEFSGGTFSVSRGNFIGSFIDPDLNNTKMTIKFTYSGNYFSAYTSSTCMRSRLCGVCGNINEDSSDDFELRNGTIISNDGSGTFTMPTPVWENTFEFGHSWCNENFTNNPDCNTPTPIPSQPPTECVNGMNRDYTDTNNISMITDLNNTIITANNSALIYCQFLWYEYCDSGCNNSINNNNNESNITSINYNNWLDNCIFDSCIASGYEITNISGYSYIDGLIDGIYDSSLGECSIFCNFTVEPYIILHDDDDEDDELSIDGIIDAFMELDDMIKMIIGGVLLCIILTCICCICRRFTKSSKSSDAEVQKAMAVVALAKIASQSQSPQSPATPQTPQSGQITFA